MVFTLQKDCLILCEGHYDTALFKALLTRPGMPDCQVTDPRDLGEPQGGITRWLPSLNRIGSATGPAILRALVIVGDNDRKPSDRKQLIRTALADAAPLSDGRVFPIPDRVFQVVGTSPKVGIMMLPRAGRRGDMETVCVRAAKRAIDDDARRCVEAFAACAKWKPNKAAKGELRAIISRLHKKDPEMSFAYIWKECPDLVPVNDRAFDHLATFLRKALS